MMGRGIIFMGFVGLKRGLWLIVLLSILVTGCGRKSSGETEGTSRGCTVSVFVQQEDTSTNIWKGWAATALYEETGITVEFYSGGKQMENKLKQYMASGAVPDMIQFQNLNQAKLYMDGGLLLALDEYQEYLPALFGQSRYEAALEYSRDNLSNGSGELCLVPVSVGTVAGIEADIMAMLQWTAYDRVGQPVVETLEDYLDVVEQMLKVKPLSNTGTRMYGFSIYQGNDGIGAHIGSWASLYGIDLGHISPLMEVNAVTGEISSVFSEDSFYRRMLHFYFEANLRELLDSDSRTQTYSSLERKISSGRVLFVREKELAKGYNDLLESFGSVAGTADGYATIAAEDMVILTEKERPVGKNCYWAIYKNSPHVKEACQLLNWLYEEENQFFLYNGPRGVLWEFDEEGCPYVTENGKELLRSSPVQLTGYQGVLEDGTSLFGDMGLTGATSTEGGYALSYRFWDSYRESGLTSLDRKMQECYGVGSVEEYLEQKQLLAEKSPAVYMVKAISEDMGENQEKIREKMEQTAWNMIYAKNEEEFERLWNELKKEAEQLGSREIEAFYEREWKRALDAAAAFREE